MLNKVGLFIVGIALFVAAGSFASTDNSRSHCDRHLTPAHCNDDRSGVCYWNYEDRRCEFRPTNCRQIFEYYSCVNSPLGCFWDDITATCQPN